MGSPSGIDKDGIIGKEVRCADPDQSGKVRDVFFVYGVKTLAVEMNDGREVHVPWSSVRAESPNVVLVDGDLLHNGFIEPWVPTSIAQLYREGKLSPGMYVIKNLQTSEGRRIGFFRVNPGIFQTVSPPWNLDDPDPRKAWAAAELARYTVDLIRSNLRRGNDTVDLEDTVHQLKQVTREIFNWMIEGVGDAVAAGPRPGGEDLPESVKEKWKTWIEQQDIDREVKEKMEKLGQQILYPATPIDYVYPQDGLDKSWEAVQLLPDDGKIRERFVATGQRSRWQLPSLRSIPKDWLKTPQEERVNKLVDDGNARRIRDILNRRWGAPLSPEERVDKLVDDGNARRIRNLLNRPGQGALQSPELGRGLLGPSFGHRQQMRINQPRTPMIRPIRRPRVSGIGIGQFSHRFGVSSGARRGNPLPHDSTDPFRHRSSMPATHPFSRNSPSPLHPALTNPIHRIGMPGTGPFRHGPGNPFPRPPMRMANPLHHGLIKPIQRHRMTLANPFRHNAPAAIRRSRIFPSRPHLQGPMSHHPFRGSSSHRVGPIIGGANHQRHSPMEHGRSFVKLGPGFSSLRPSGGSITRGGSGGIAKVLALRGLTNQSPGPANQSRRPGLDRIHSSSRTSTLAARNSRASKTRGISSTRSGSVPKRLTPKWDNYWTQYWKLHYTNFKAMGYKMGAEAEYYYRKGASPTKGISVKSTTSRPAAIKPPPKPPPKPVSRILK